MGERRKAPRLGASPVGGDAAPLADASAEQAAESTVIDADIGATLARELADRSRSNAANGAADPPTIGGARSPGAVRVEALDLEGQPAAIEQVQKGEMTLLDFSTQLDLGLDFEPSRSKDAVGRAGKIGRAQLPEPPHVEKSTVAPHGFEEDDVEEDDAEEGDVEESGATSKAASAGTDERGSRAASSEDTSSPPQAHEPARPREAPRRLRPPRGETVFQHLPRWLFATESAAKLIPVLLMVAVASSTLLAMVMILHGLIGGTTEHVTLRLMQVAKPDPDRAPTAMMFTIETEPEGVIVVLDAKILGPTPLTFELPNASSRVGVELTSPYYETWLGEALREPTGELHVNVKLTRKR